jgi:ABC-type Fe3+-hydroxamate transport system substrate-binding protein
MRHRVLQCCFVVMLLIPLGGCARSSAEVHQGKVVTAGIGKLTMTDVAGQNQHTHDVPSDVTITCGGKPCGLNELKAGSTIAVTTEKKGDQTLVTKIEMQEAST